MDRLPAARTVEQAGPLYRYDTTVHTQDENAQRRPPSPGQSATAQPSREPAAPRKRPGLVYLLLFALHAALVVYGSFVPLEFRRVPLEKALDRFRNMPYLRLGIYSRGDLMANFLLFVPMTFLAMGALTREGRGRLRVLSAVVTVAFATLLALAIEFAQIYFPNRTFSQNDVCAEILGGLFGVGVWFCVGRRVTGWARGLRQQQGPRPLAVKLLSGYAVFLVVYLLVPFDLTIRPAEIRSKLTGAKVTLVPFTDAVEVSSFTVIEKTAVIVPIGFLLAARRRRRRLALLAPTAQSCLFVLALETAQLLVYSRYSSATDVVLGTVGGFLGVAAAQGFGPTARRPVLLTAAWDRYGTRIKLAAVMVLLAAVAWQKWYPFNFRWPEGGLSAMAEELLVVPFRRQHGMREEAAFAQFVREFAASFLIGMLLRSLLRPRSRVGVVASGFCAVAVACSFELAQVLLPQRLGDLTGLLINTAGAIAGVRLLPGFVRVFLLPEARTAGPPERATTVWR